jgi:hypothetical protein
MSSDELKTYLNYLNKVRRRFENIWPDKVHKMCKGILAAKAMNS